MGDDVGVPYVRGSETSKAAAESLLASLGFTQRMILKAIIRHEYAGATCDELEAELNLRHQTAGPRLKELCDMRAIRRTDSSRATRSGPAGRRLHRAAVCGGLFDVKPGDLYFITERDTRERIAPIGRRIGAAAKAFLDRFFELLDPLRRAEEGDHRCDQCLAVYDGNHCCPLQVVGECYGECNGATRLVSLAGCCDTCGSARILDRRFLHSGLYRCGTRPDGRFEMGGSMR